MARSRCGEQPDARTQAQFNTLATRGGCAVESLLLLDLETWSGRATVPGCLQDKKEILYASESLSVGTWHRGIVLPGSAFDLFRPSESQKRRGFFLGFLDGQSRHDLQALRQFLSIRNGRMD